MEPKSARDPSDFLGYTIVRLAHVLQRHMDDALAPAGLNARQFSVLALLAKNPNISGGKLARMVLVTPQSMSELLVTLVAAGLVQRDEETGRGRAMHVRVTQQGKRALGRAFPLVEALEQQTTQTLSQGQIVTLNQRLHAMLATLSPPDEPA